MADKIFPESQLPIRKTSELLPQVFKTEANEKFLGGVLDPLVQPGVLQKTVGYIGRRYGKTFNGADIYLDSDETLRSRYQLEPGVVLKDGEKINNFFDYLDFKNQLHFFGNYGENDKVITNQEHYSWNPPIDWDKFVNFREYYWIPDGPPPIYIDGQAQGITSTYRVKSGSTDSYVFYPDGLTNNPALTLYRGQTYKFNVNAPSDGLTIRTSYDTGTLRYNPDLAYPKGALVVFNNKLWRALSNIPQGDGSTIDEQSQDWEFVESAATASALDYNNGVTNNGIENGVLTFEVPFDAPDVLYYQSKVNPNKLGRFVIGNVDTNTKIDVEKEIVGKATYTSANGITFSNGMIIRFSGEVLPEKYSSSESWIVEGVGTSITLVKFSDLVISSGLNPEVPEVLFDNSGFDTDPYDDATYYPGKKDYIVINRASQDLNPWSRYNRWFHRSVLEQAYTLSGSDFNSSETARAKRPIIEFKPHYQLINHGAIAKTSVDYVDDFTTDIFSTIEGSRGYIVDGEELFQGARVLVISDTDSLANNKIYSVNFINHNSIIEASRIYSFSDLQSTGIISVAGEFYSTETISAEYRLSIETTIDDLVQSLNSDRIFIRKYIASRVNQTLKITANRRSTITAGDIENNFTVRMKIRYNSLNLALDSEPSEITERIRQINLVPTEDSESIIGEGVLVKRGKTNQRIMYHFDGTSWSKSQLKTAVNQPPLFDVFDENGVSYADTETYPVSSFNGTEVISYKTGTGTVDTELGFALSYLNIDNVGDIQFEFDWDKDIATYQIQQDILSKTIRSGYLKDTKNNSYDNCWLLNDNTFIQPIIDSKVIGEATLSIKFETVDWRSFENEEEKRIDVYVNGKKTTAYSRILGTFTFETTLIKGDTVFIKVFCKTTPDKGFYEIPIGLEKNPLNNTLESFTYGTATDHVKTAIEFYDELIGAVPGLSNLRDLSGFEKYGTRIVKHSHVSAIAMTLLCDRDINIVKSLQYAKKQYTEFKSSFLDLASKLYFNQDPAELVDAVILEMNKVKKSTDPFADSDMIGSGAYSLLEYLVEDDGIKTFALSEKFDLETPSRRAVYVYINNRQLIANTDYTFNSTFGFVNLNVAIAEGDTIKIKEYISTATSFIPPTPTKMGLYKKYLPQKFIDDTYLTPTEVIQGHDGSITVAYGDFRDDILLELEYRIYNNIKKQYNENVFNIDNVVSSYYGYGEYDKQQFDVILDREFLKWISDTNIDYINNNYFDSENPFTYTYSNMTGPNGSTNLPGWWRGVYKWFFDTDRPHRCPWEMLGFSEKPTWWEEEYGAAPYTKNNLLLWDDLEAGIIRQGPRAGIVDRYKRPGLTSYIPVDEHGKLVNPLDCGLANNFTLINNKGSFKLGDMSPVESAWRYSSEYPFATVISMCLLKPFEYITDNLDNFSTTVNILGQTVDAESKTFSTISDINYPVTGDVLGSGLIVYSLNYLKSKGLSQTLIKDKFNSIDILLSNRMSGFVDKNNQKFILDSKNPNSKSGSVFIPPENYDIIFNQSAPISSISYSGVVVEKDNRGWRISGYDQLDPYFVYFKPVASQNDPLMSVGGVSENFLEWTPDKFYGNGVVVRASGVYYRSIRSHTSGTSFETINWQKLSKLPVVGGVEALFRRNFNTLRIQRLVYGTILDSVQDVVDFLLGYQAYLKATGVIFDGYDPQTQSAKDFTTSAKEFMFWTKQNWEIGSLLALSPLADKLTANISVGVVDNLLDGFYEYNIYKSDGTPLQPEYINVLRDFQTFQISTTNTTDGIYYLKAYLVLKEHVAIFDDRTVFNDVIYDKTTGYRQERVKSRGFRTTDWDGDYTSPGFLFDNVDIKVWQPFTDYKLGDIVSYKSYNWTSLVNQPGSETFINDYWSKLDSTPVKQLVPNFDYRINQIEDYYDLDADGLGNSQRDLARHAIGYQKRQYLQDLAEDEVTQFKLYQGFIREKGTANAIVKIFDKTSRVEDDSVVLNEEWAFRVGEFGGVDQITEIEFNLQKDAFQVNPQPVIVNETKQTGNVILDQYLRVSPSDFSIKPIPFTKNVNDVEYFSDMNRSAGFVKLDQVDFIIKTRENILDLNINAMVENDHVWITFDDAVNGFWSILRFNESKVIFITDVSPVLNDRVTVTLNRYHSYQIGDYIGIKGIPNLSGFFKIVDVTIRDIIVAVEAGTSDPEYDSSTQTFIYEFTTAKFDSYNDFNPQQAALLPTGSKIWIAANENNRWEVVEKTKQYNPKLIADYGITDPEGLGYTTVYSQTLAQVIASIPTSNYVAIYKESTTGLNFYGSIAPTDTLLNKTNSSWGQSIAVSADGRLLLIGAPKASGVISTYRGDYDPLGYYFLGEVVKHGNRLWRATQDNFGDGSTIDVYSDRWEPTTVVEANNIGRGAGYFEQGMVSVYEWQDQQWNYKTTLLSPMQDDQEEFGHQITISKSGSTYYVGISAPGALDDRGRVYLFTYDGTTWNGLVETSYAGQYTSSTYYPAGTIVYYDNKLWEAQEEILPDGSTISLEGDTKWVQIDSITTETSLPKNVFYDDDGSTLSAGAISTAELSALTKQGDRFGHSMAMNRDGSVLVIGVPNSDSQFFANFKGDWKSFIEYTEGEIVRHEGRYYKLVDPRVHDEDWDSTVLYTSKGADTAGDPWVEVGDSTASVTGKIFVYQRDENNRYALKQTITGGNLSSIDDTGIQHLASGDKFGYAVDIDYTGTTIVVSAPEADLTFTNQGAVYVLETAGLASIEYRVKQRLESYERDANASFGSSVAISNATEQIVVGARNAPYKLYTSFDVATTFDQGKTVFSEDQGYPGQVYVYQRKDSVYFLAEKLETDFVTFEGFGFSVDCGPNTVVVGSPNYTIVETLSASEIVSGKRYEIAGVGPVGSTTDFTIYGAANNDIGTVFVATSDGTDETGLGTVIKNSKIGNVRLFKKSSSANSWNTLTTEEMLVSNKNIERISLFDTESNIKITDLDFVDHFKNKILGIAEQEIYYKTLYDPAVYSLGTDEQVVNPGQSWREKQVGRVWWDLSTVKWVNYEQGDLSYRVGNWNKLAEGASIDIYEWVETPLLPSEWAIIADSVEGLSNNISGQPLYPNDSVYSVKEIYNSTTGELTGTLYYYWVKNKTITPQVSGRTLPISEITSLITDPASSGSPLIAFVAADKFVLWNVQDIIPNNKSYINIQYKKHNVEIKPIHREYQLLTEGIADSVPTEYLERKWIDSLVGFDQKGNTVPDTSLAEKQKYGLSFRPRQSMFKNRETILKIVVNYINNILLQSPFADTMNFKTLNLNDPLPSEELNDYDIAVDTYIDLEQIGTARVRQAVLTPQIVNGEIESIIITDPGFGYRLTPRIEIEGTGSKASAEIQIDGQGRVISATVLTRGKKYNSAIVKIREFSVLVRSDSTAENSWSIYSWDQQRNIFYRSRSQGFDTTRYWEYIDWWKPGYDITTRINVEIAGFYLEPTLNLTKGDIVRVKEYGNGGWAIFERTADGQGDVADNYNLIARQNGTVKLKESLYNIKTTPIGFDNVGSYDTAYYDLQPTQELRNILQAVKEDIFVDNLSVEWNKLFFACVNYAFSEQENLTWAFKTSFLNAVHNIGPLEQKISYKNDNLESYKEYLEEVKPYRTTIREYTSRYTNLENTNTAVTDFDSPPAYSVQEGKILPVTVGSEVGSSYPWKYWVDNSSFSITSIELAYQGSGYITPPTVVIQGNGSGATAKAYISNGRVSAIRVINEGTGYTSTPTVTLVGGNGNSGDPAIAVPVLGNTKARVFNINVKFDRISKSGIYTNFEQSQTFVANGSTSTFELNYAPTRDKTKITILKNSQLVLSNEYSINLYISSTDTYGLLKGKIIFAVAPEAGDLIEITYEKNDELLDSVNRINKFYAPTPGMKGQELNQLMTGIDFGGVQVQGTTFDVTGGWDALPWFTEGWDSVESNGDYYVVCDGSTSEITLPYTPHAGQIITIYIKRSSTSPYTGLSPDSTFERAIDNLGYAAEYGQDTRMIRIDDPYFDLYDGSTVQANGRVTAPTNAVMPSFVGDGIKNTIQFVNPETDIPYINTQEGDTLIFRTIFSDGSVVLNDVNLVDTIVSGGTLASLGDAYINALGTSAEELVIDGDGFVTPDQVPAPEEQVPGQVLDSVSIKVYNLTPDGAAPIQNKLAFGDGITRFFDIGLRTMETKNILVYVDKVRQTSNDYTVSFFTNQVEFVDAPSAGTLIEIIALGVGGIALLDYQEFIADGETSLFLTNALYDQTTSVVVTVDGVEYDTGFINSTGVVDEENRTLIQFGFKPELNQVIKVICLSAAADVDSTGVSLVRVNEQTFVYDGSTRSFGLDNFVVLERGSAKSSVLVRVNDVELKGVDTVYTVYNGSNNQIVIGVDPAEAVGSITSGNIKVYINGTLQRFVLDYVFDGNQNLITISEDNLSEGDEIKIEIDLRTEFRISGNDIIVDPLVSLTEGDTITVTWFGEYPSMDIITDEYAGGKNVYITERTPLAVSYVWVYKNGLRLRQDQDYSLSLPRGVIYLREETNTSDSIKIVQFGKAIRKAPVAYELYKDMLNTHYFKRYSVTDGLKLAKDLNYYDQTIELEDATSLFNPRAMRNIPGVVIINNERIEYLEKNGNTLSKLRRGSLGTSIGELYPAGSYVVDSSISESIPYNEEQLRTDFVSDGSSLLMGPLEYVPVKSSRNFYRSTELVNGTLVYNSIPLENGACDQIEVFVGGKRLRKSSLSVYTEELGSSSPDADELLEAEFSVDGTTPFVRLTAAVPAGTRITIIKRIGKAWYDRGDTTATTGVTFLDNATPMVRFISEKTTELPE